MREIKFRAWDKQHKIMIENVTPFQSDFVLERTSWTCLKSHDDKGEASFRLYGHTFDVLMQFTGIYDKKKKPIYEGDILRSNISNVGFVRHSDSICWYISYNLINNPTLKNPPNENLISQLWDSQDRWEIIGNIYSNPELLKGGE